MPRAPRRPPHLAGNTLCIPDLHAPYHHRRALSFLASIKAEYAPARVLILGDMIDGLTASRYATQSAAKGADDEFRGARDFLRRLARMFPVADVVLGNHDIRVEKKAAEHGIATDRIRPLWEVSELVEPLRGWTFHEKFRVSPEILATHGDGLGGANPGEMAVLKYRRNVVIGHLHARFGVQYYSRGDWTNWCLHAGCLADSQAVAANYAKHHNKQPIHGASVLLNGVTPLPLPM